MPRTISKHDIARIARILHYDPREVLAAHITPDEVRLTVFVLDPANKAKILENGRPKKRLVVHKIR